MGEKEYRKCKFTSRMKSRTDQNILTSSKHRRTLELVVQFFGFVLWTCNEVYILKVNSFVVIVSNEV